LFGREEKGWGKTRENFDLDREMYAKK